MSTSLSKILTFYIVQFYLSKKWIYFRCVYTHSFPIRPFSALWGRQGAVGFSDVFGGGGVEGLFWQWAKFSSWGGILVCVWACSWYHGLEWVTTLALSRLCGGLVGCVQDRELATHARLTCRSLCWWEAPVTLYLWFRFYT